MSTFNRAFVNQMVVYTLVTIGFTGSIGVASVWMRHEIAVTANENKQIEARIAQVERLAQQTGAWVAEEQDVTALLRRNAEWHLGLVPPQEEQVVRVGEDPVIHLASKRDRGLFRGGLEPVQFRVALQR